MKIGDLLQKKPNDRYNLQRFENAQAFVFDEALMEVHAGKVQTNWVIFTFPQVVGLGKSDSSLEFGIASIEEARAYVQNEELWGNYLELLEVLMMHKGTLPQLIFGKNDAMKLKSSLTLFNFIKPKEVIIKKVLDTFYQGQTDKKTLEIIKQMKQKKG
ncbi:DUF1810 domain-containing protein [Faecalibacter bovis]|uniref:DUF1810 family protein n=1 Tax=Faecalibacter bovis TaxID=2898187 RepID=A0ABX7XBI4_9FLAO|nr:DUF1810 family protein [Faecalibacter bovis]QTV05243.1 DUF1810 family protein [Faecalibacter bovis]